MHARKEKRRERWCEEEAFQQFNSVFDFDLYCLELQHNGTLGTAIRNAVCGDLQRRETAFARMLACHPATIAEDGRRQLARQLEQKRLEQIRAAKERKGRQFMEGLRHLAEKWSATLITH